MEDQEQDDQGDKAGLASSSSSEGDIELPTASDPRHQSLSKSHPKPAVPRQRPVVPPRPKETNTSNSNSLEPTPFDLPDHDPFQAFENNEKDPKPEGEQKKTSPPTAPKPKGLTKSQKLLQNTDTTSSSSTTSGAQSEVNSVYY